MIYNLCRYIKQLSRPGQNISRISRESISHSSMFAILSQAFAFQLQRSRVCRTMFANNSPTRYVCLLYFSIQREKQVKDSNTYHRYSWVGIMISQVWERSEALGTGLDRAACDWETRWLDCNSNAGCAFETSLVSGSHVFGGARDDSRENIGSVDYGIHPKWLNKLNHFNRNVIILKISFVRL